MSGRPMHRPTLPEQAWLMTTLPSLPSPSAPGRAMALDLGERRIGIALSDPGRQLARGYTVIQRRSRREDFARYHQIIAQQGVTLVVIGLPVRLDGSDSPTTRWVRDYAAACAAALPTPVLLWDESLTTRQAQMTLHQQGGRRDQRAQRLDAVAAAHILQHYLDAHQNDAPQDVRTPFDATQPTPPDT